MVEYYNCQEYGCKYSTQKKADLLRHTRAKHTHDVNSKPFKCYHCGIGSSRKDNLKRHEAIRTRNTLNGFSSLMIEGDALPHSISQALSSPAAPTSGVVVSWPSPGSRQSGREDPLSVIYRFVADSPPSSTIVALSPPGPIPVISIESHAAYPEDVDSGSDIEVKDEDETSFYERSKPDRTKGSVEAESGTSQKKRKSRTPDDSEDTFARGSKQRTGSNTTHTGSNDRQQTDDNEGQLVVANKDRTPSKDYKHGLPCPFYNFNPTEYPECIKCSFNSISHLW